MRTLLPHAALVSLLALAGSGCATQRTFQCNARGGPAWRELSTGRVILSTELEPDAARELAAEVHRLAVIASEVLGPGAGGALAPLRVVAFRRRPDALGQARWRFVGPPPGPATSARGTEVLWLATHDEGPIVLYGPLGAGTRAIVAHGLAHQALAAAGIHAPRWYLEGTAGWLESLGIEKVSGPPRLGEVPPRFDRTLEYDPWGARIRASQLLEGYVAEHDSPFVRMDADSTTAWQLVHLLRARHGPAVAEFQARLARGEAPLAAWAAAFPQWEPSSASATAALDEAVRAYLPDDADAREAHPVEEARISERTLTSSEVHTLRLLADRTTLPEHRAADPGSLAAEAEEALAEDAGHVAALWTLALQRRPEAPTLAQRAVAAHPEDPLAWRLVALAAADAPGRDAALRKALELAPDDPVLLGELSTSAGAQRRLAEALELATRRVRRARGDSAAHSALGLLQAAAGQCDDARSELLRARDVLSFRGRDRELTLLASRSEAARVACPAIPPLVQVKP